MAHTIRDLDLHEWGVSFTLPAGSVVHRDPQNSGRYIVSDMYELIMLTRSYEKPRSSPLYIPAEEVEETPPGMTEVTKEQFYAYINPLNVYNSLSRAEYGTWKTANGRLIGRSYPGYKYPWRKKEYFLTYAAAATVTEHKELSPIDEALHTETAA